MFRRGKLIISSQQSAGAGGGQSGQSVRAGAAGCWRDAGEAALRRLCDAPSSTNKSQFQARLYQPSLHTTSLYQSPVTKSSF